MSNNDRSASVEIAIEFIYETDSAILINDGDNKVWIPKSQLKGFNSNRHSAGDHIEIECSEWFATQKGLI